MKNSIKSAAKWDERFNAEEYRYGKEANEFLKSGYHEIPKGNVLCIGEGEGRNSVFLAKQGYNVTALDYSIVGLEKTENLAKENNVLIHLIHADITQYKFEKNYWQGIVSIFCHFDKINRQKVHQNCVNALATEGIFLLEAYAPNQLKYGTGGPKTIDLLMELSEVKDELKGLHFLTAREIEREIFEGSLHKGKGSVIQILGKKV
jgi:SAM-dependent methyltransferase